MNPLGYRRIISYLVTALVLFGSGWLTHDWYHRYNDVNLHRRVKAVGFRFTSPLLDVELPEGIRINQEPISFKYSIKKFVQKQIDSGKAQRISVYYRDLEDGPWFGINENQEFDPASMMKVPVMIAWLKRAEKDAQVLKRTFVYDGTQDMALQQSIKPASSISPGSRYTVDELLHYMLNFSDNNATSLLFSDLKTVELNEVLDGMDVINNPREETNSITVHGYSGFFRILYNASYLNREMSEKALQYLSLQDFPQGIAAGVPEGTVVAAKFGEHAWGERGEEKQLHEFGIVYHPKGHYILGIMTQGRDFDRQAEIIRDVSKLIYQSVDSATVLGGGR
jgi:beta-lactamase class A